MLNKSDGTGSTDMFARIVSIIAPTSAGFFPGKTRCTRGRSLLSARTCCCNVDTRPVKSEETTGCTIDSGTFCPSIRTTDWEVYLGGNAYEIRYPAKGARRA